MLRRVNGSPDISGDPLVNEKWELMQENAKLEGQMKQMQKLLYAEKA